MNKLIRVGVFLLAIATFSTADAHAQAIGFKVGPTFSSMSIHPDEETDRTSLTSFGAGAFLRFGIGTGMALQLEALALTKGTRIANDSLNIDVATKFDYIEVPITLMIAIGTGPYAFVGPSLSFERGCKVDSEVGGDEFESNCDNLLGEGTFTRRKLDLGATGGLGLQMPFGPGMVLLEGRYTHGFSNINDSSDSDTRLRHRSYGLFAGYSIGFGR
jgi:hypothetical protein